ncbi:MAG: type II secretion system protein [Deltaproteobacteria bacterium]|nr:type II secretion system protein [Deltaproteobacteria bacterium]
MRRESGFTLVELLAVIAIVGILAATAVPLYRTMQQRTYGREATVMMKQLLDAQVIYFLEKNKFYPEDETPIDIWSTDSPSKAEIQQVKDALNVVIPVGHKLDYSFYAENLPGNESFHVTISSIGMNFPLFKDGSPSITGSVDRTGKFTFVIPY